MFMVACINVYVNGMNTINNSTKQRHYVRFSHLHLLLGLPAACMVLSGGTRAVVRAVE